MKNTVYSALPVRRRAVLALGGAMAALATTPVRAGNLDAGGFGIVPNSEADQTDALQAAIDAAATEGKILALDAGIYRVRQLVLASAVAITGSAGATRLVALSGDPVLVGSTLANVALSAIFFDGSGLGSGDGFSGLVRFEGCEGVVIEACGFANGSGNGVYLAACSGRVAQCQFSGFGETALFANDSTGLVLTGNRIADCGNGGIRVFRSAAGEDGTIVTENHIANIRSGSGNGQNGNGINVFRAKGVIVSDNRVGDVDFSAIRLNSTEDCVVRGNIASDCREVAIFSEFAFSGSIIADNLIDGAATGISITNFDNGGRLAVCSGNLVRNITPLSPTNPDTMPVGIFAEADTAVTGNVVEAVPGVGIGAGWGAFLRDVLVANNLVRDCKVGIGVSVADGAGRARIAGNLVSGSVDRAISGFAWTEMRGTDLGTDPGQFANVAVEANTVG